MGAGFISQIIKGDKPICQADKGRRGVLAKILNRNGPKCRGSGKIGAYSKCLWKMGKDPLSKLMGH